VPIRHGPVQLVTERFVRAAHRARLPVQVWTIDDGPTMRRLLELGVDAIMTNRPSLAFEIVRT
jgi:glycerophosphoryl diester phosphodiesterase